METPVRISFQGSTPSEALSALISEETDALERYHGRLTSCQVVVKVPDRHHRNGGLYSVNIHVVLPGNIDVNVDHTPQADERFADPIFAVNDALLLQIGEHLNQVLVPERFIGSERELKGGAAHMIHEDQQLIRGDAGVLG